MADLLLLLFFITTSLLLFTAVDRILVFRPSRQEVRRLLVAIEDLVLPFGSFPSKLLHPWTSTVEDCASNPTASPPSPKPASDSTESSEDEISPLIWLTSDDGVSKPIIRSPPAVPTPNNSASKPTTLSPLSGPLPVDTGFIITTTPNASTPSPDGGHSVDSEDHADDIFFDSLENHPAIDNDAQVVVSGVEPLPQQEDNSTAVMAATLKKAQAFENAIRELVDTQGMHGPDPQRLVEVIAGTMERRTKVEMDLRLLQQRNEELDEEDYTLQSQIGEAKEKRRLQEDEYNNRMRILHAEKESAEEIATTATLGVEGRIDALKKKYEKEKQAAAFSNLQAQNGLICSKRMVEDSLGDARRQLDVHDQQRKAETKEQNSTVRELKEKIGQLRSSVTSTEELAASSERRLKKQFEDQAKDKDSEIAALKNENRASKETVKEMSKWKGVAEREQQNSQRLSDRLQEDTATLRDQKTHIVGCLNLDIQGLKRTVRTNEATIDQLQGTIIGLESGEEVQSLRKQLEQATGDRDRELKNEGQRSAEQKKLSRKIEISRSAEREARIQVQRLEDEKKGKTTEHQKAITDKDEEIRCLKQAVQEAKQTADARTKEFEKQVNDFCMDKQRQLQEDKKNIAQSAEQEARTQLQRLEDEEKRKTTEHQKAMTEKDEEIHRLRQTIQGAKEAVDARFTELEKKANDFCMDKERQHFKEFEKKANDFCMEKERQHQEDKGKAVEEAAKRAAEDARQMFQKQLEDERRVSLETQDKAAKVENDLRTEMGVLRSQVEKSAEPKSVTPAEHQPGEDAREVTILATETMDANSLLLEIEKNGIVLGTTQHTVLQDLNTAKLALYKFKMELRDPDSVMDITGFLNIIYGADVDEERIQKLDTVMQAALARQARVINARLQNLRKILRTSDGIQKDAMLEAIHTKNPMNREIRKPRGLRRQMQPGPAMPPSNSAAGGPAEVPMDLAQYLHGNSQHDLRVPSTVSK